MVTKNIFLKRKKTHAGMLMSSLLLLASSPAMALDTAEFEQQMNSYLAKPENVEKIGEVLEAHFRKKREDEQKKAAESEQKELEDQFNNPIKLDVSNSPARGKADAKITVVEFSDFQCPYCQRGASVMDELLKEYPNDVKVVFKHLPLPFHAQAKPASRAALAAGEQGKFWEMHDALFKNQQNLTDEGFLEMAKGISGLNVDKFKADLTANASKYDKVIEDDVALATKHGVRGTPGFFVNGVQVRGARPLPYFKDIVERWKTKLQ
ncbi:MAG: thioredoxin domain-containing protein [Deltaproteobacteria bacterium]|nr:thioredoxin domain-containing protein [Deltaproteobacteria bacterium]